VSRSKIEEAGFLRVSEELGVPVSEVSRAVKSFFDSIASDARRLPFNDRTRIYSRQKFETLVSVVNIPYIGRLGPVYSRYCKWRENESKTLPQKSREDYRSRMTQDDIENIAEAVLSGNPVPEIKKRKRSELFDRVWFVGTDGKKSARQVLEK
jgi:hypothetical protein